MTDTPYEKWLAERRGVSPPATLADQIMSQVAEAELERQRRNLWWLRVIQQIEQSRAARWAVCGGALAVGCLPFVFLAHAAQLVSF
jgi:hypothetical protein